MSTARNEGGPRPSTGRDRSSSTADSQLGSRDAGQDLLFEQVMIEAHNRRRRVMELPSLLAKSIALVWRTNRTGFATSLAVQVAGAGIAAAQVLIAGYAVRELVKGGTTHLSASLILALLALAVVTTVGGLSAAGTSQLARYLGEQVERRVTAEVLDVTGSVELITFEDPTWYDQLSRMLTTLPIQPTTIVNAIAGVVTGVVGAAVLLVTLLVLSPLLVVVLVVAGVPLWYFSRRGGRIEFDFAVRQTPGVRERTYLLELLTKRENAAEVRAYATAPTLTRRWSSSYDQFLLAFRALIRRRYTLQIASTSTLAVATGATLAILVWLVDRGSLSVSESATAVVAARLLASRIETLLSGMGALFQSALFLQDFKLFSARRAQIGGSDADTARTHRPSPTPADAAPTEPASITGRVDLADVTFRYPNSPHDAVHPTSVSIDAGQVVALVGENGSGKTTLAKLLAGLYLPTTGTVRWKTSAAGSIDARTAAPQLTLVLQDFLRYQLSAKDNIELGRPGDDDPNTARVTSAAAEADIDDLICSLPDGYATRLSRQFSGGRDLSVGQWQRVALARAFYREGAAIILDEPAAALDPRAEARLYDSMRRLFTGRTVVLITHRLRSVRNADRILVMRDGAIVEDGTHESLMQQSGLYAELIRLQDAGTVGVTASTQSNSNIISN